jgi:hypothetical protein
LRQLDVRIVASRTDGWMVRLASISGRWAEPACCAAWFLAAKRRFHPGDGRCRGGRSVRALHRLGPSDGRLAARGKDGTAHHAAQHQRDRRTPPRRPHQRHPPRNVDLDTTLTCARNLRSHHLILIDAGYADLDIPIPWWNDRTLSFRFPPRRPQPSPGVTSTPASGIVTRAMRR